MQRIRSVAWIVPVALALGVTSAQAPSPVHLSVDGRASANVGLAVRGNRVAAAWSARLPDGGMDIYAAVSADGGRTFGAPVRVNDNPGTARVNGEMAPRVAFVPRGKRPFAIDVLWTAREGGGAGSTTTIRVARSVDGGRTFGASRELQRAGAAGDRGWAALTADRRGTIHVVWLDHRGMAAARASRDAAAGGAHHHGHAPTATPAAASDGAAAAQASGLYYSNGSAERELVKGVCYCCKTALAAGADGTLFAAWRHVYAGNMRDIAFTVSRDGGRTFSPAARVSEDRWQLNGCPDDGPALAVDAEGTAHIVWPTVTTQPEPHKAAFYATTRDGKTFTARTRVSPTRRNIAHPQIVVGEDGEVAVFWDEIVNNRRRVFLSRRTESGLFDAPEALSDGTSASYPVPVPVPGGLLVAWTEGSGNDSRIVVRRLPLR